MNDKITREKMMEMLSEYPEKKRKISLLRYELEHPATVSAEEMLESMSFAHGGGEGHSSGNVSNKTLYIAMNYQMEAEKANTETVKSILRRLVPLEQEVKRMDYYLGLLPNDEQEVVRRSFFNEQPFSEISEAMSISLWTVRKLRNTALDKLTDMIQFVKEGEK